MLVTMAGAMSTAELGLSLAEMIRQDKVHAICCTGANLEEDVFNLVAHDHYVRVPQLPRPHARGRAGAARAPPQPRHRHLHPRGRGDAPHRARRAARCGRRPTRKGERCFPHEFLYRCCAADALEEHYQIDPQDSWLLAAAEKNLPIFVPGWEDSTLGNIYAAHCIARRREERRTPCARGIEYMMALADWYTKTAPKRRSASSRSAAASPATSRSASCRCCTRTCSGTSVPLWGYFCQISDSTTSYGSYSGAVPNEKITWGKLGVDDAEVRHRVRRHDRRAADLRLRARLVGPQLGQTRTTEPDGTWCVRRPSSPASTTTMSLSAVLTFAHTTQPPS